MQFSIPTALWKAIRSALLAGLAVILASGSIDVFFDTMSSQLQPLIPIATIPIAAAIITFLRNFVKQYLASVK